MVFFRISKTKKHIHQLHSHCNTLHIKEIEKNTFLANAYGNHKLHNAKINFTKALECLVMVTMQLHGDEGWFRAADST